MGREYGPRWGQWWLRVKEMFQSFSVEAPRTTPQELAGDVNLKNIIYPHDRKGGGLVVCSITIWLKHLSFV